MFFHHARGAAPGQSVISARPRHHRRGGRKPGWRCVLHFIQLDERRLPSTLTVTSPLDAGAGTLRQAILDARGGDTIDFSAALRGRTITLTSGELAIDK